MRLQPSARRPTGRASTEPPVSSVSVTTPRSQVIDGFRGLAILAVLCFHYLYRWAPPDAATDAYGYDGVYTWPAFGWSGVDLFFIVSGLVISMTLLRSAGALEFAVRRFARIYPAFLAASVLIVLVLALHDPLGLKVGPRDFLMTLSLLPANLGHWKPVDGAFWTLTVEVRFYAYAALSFALLGRRFWVGLVAVAVAGGVAGLWSSQIANGLFIADWMGVFLFGIAIWFALFEHRAGAAAACALTGLALYILRAGPLDGHPGPVLAAHAFILGGGGLMALLLWKAPNLPLGPLPWIGRISYSLYLIHQYLGVTLIHDLKQAGAPDWAAFLGTVGSAMLLAWAGFHLVEQPGQRFVMRLYGRLRTGRPKPYRPTVLGPVARPVSLAVIHRQTADE